MTSRVLVVDDSLTVRMDLAAALEGAQLEPVLVASGADARAALLRESFALIILDVILPDDDGISILEAIRATPETAQVPVMLLSSEAEVRDRIRGLATGADDYVGKPYDVAYVVARAREFVRRSRDSERAAKTTVLVIDDSRTYRERLREQLEEAGYRVLLAESGEEGLGIAANDRPDAIIVDGLLPGIDGETVIRRVRLDGALRRTPCVLITASVDRNMELAALEAGADAFVSKDDAPEVALARITAVLRSSPTVMRGPETSALGPKKILAVDDSVTFLNEVGALLRKDGHEVVLAHSGEEALELLAIERVDCILLDLEMPGLGGHETCRRIKGAPVVRETPLIMVTAVDDRDAMLQGFAAGADDYISKTGDLSVLRARVTAQIRRKQFEDENRRIREELLRKELEAHEARAARELADTTAELLADVERKNKELEAFSYSVSHDLRGPLRAMDGFSRALLEDYADKLDDTGRDYLERVRAGARRMGELIEDLLSLSRLARGALNIASFDLVELVRDVFDQARRKEADREVRLVLPERLIVEADRRLVRVMLENLVGNAIKFTSKVDQPTIELGSTSHESGLAYFIRDNGAGFDMNHAVRLFAPFQRLHSEAEFPGTGIGLATVHRIVDRHGGKVWAEGRVGHGATIYFTLSTPS